MTGNQDNLSTLPLLPQVKILLIVLRMRSTSHGSYPTFTDPPPTTDALITTILLHRSLALLSLLGFLTELPLSTSKPTTELKHNFS